MERPPSEQPGRMLPDEDAPLSVRETRFDALLEERFSPAHRSEFERQLAEHDRSGASRGMDRDWLRRNLRFRGDVPDKVRQLLADWIFELMAFAVERGVALRDPHHQLEVYARAAFEAEQGALPTGLKLPASSYHYNPVYRRYTVRVVLPERIATTEALFTVMRALLTRLYGDIFLREEIFPLEVYREDMEQSDQDVSVGLSEKIAVLAELPHTSGALEQALVAHARMVGINHRRQPEQTRKAFFKELRRDLETRRLAPEREALVSEVFDGYLASLRADLSGGIQALLETAETLNRQLTFLPPDEGPEYQRLREKNPLHFLRSVKLRLEFLLEAFAGLIEDFDALAEPAAPLSPLAEERVVGWQIELERQLLARPYLVPGVRLSDELQRKRTAFPLEVHGLMARFPATENHGQLFKSLSKKLESSIHQRLYNALLLLRHWIHLQESGRQAAFPRSGQYQALKGLVANFRYRRPLLESLFVRIGVVLDVAERGEPQLPGGERRARFPVEAFARAWGQFAAHALLAEFLARRGAVKGFDPARYWKQVTDRLVSQIASGNTGAQLVYLLRRIQQGGGDDDGLPVLAEALRQSTASFRFAVTQGLKPPPQGKSAAAWLAQLDAWAASVHQARERSLQNAIVVGESAAR